MLTALIAFFLGVLFAPVIRPLLRPLFVEVMKVSILTAEEARRISAQVKEDMEDAVAEANAERAAKQRAADERAPSANGPTGPSSSAGPGTTARGADVPLDQPR